MEKQGVIKPGVTPPRDKPAGEKQAEKPTTASLDNDVTKRLADAAAAASKPR